MNRLFACFMKKDGYERDMMIIVSKQFYCYIIWHYCFFIEQGAITFQREFVLEICHFIFEQHAKSNRTENNRIS